MKKIRRLLLILILVNHIFLSGCWDSREINEIGLVTAVGVDKDESTNNFLVTVQVANPSSGSSGGDSEGKNEWIATGEGESIFDAARKLVEISSRRITWAHNNVVIIGESLAKAGIIPVIDFFTHNPELRMKTAVVVSKGDAREYVAAKAGMESPSGLSFILLEGYRAISAENVESHMLQVSSSLKNKYTNPLISEISFNKSIMNAEEGNNKQETIDLSGTAIFKRDKMLGWLSPEESLGIAWILDETDYTLVTVKDPEHENESVSVETSGIKVKIQSEVVDGMPRVSIRLTGKGKIVEEDDTTGSGINELKGNVAKLISKKIEDTIKNSLEIVQKKYMVDVLGLAAIVHTQNDRVWHKELSDKWEKIFPEIPIKVSVDIKINSSTLNQEPFKIY